MNEVFQALWKYICIFGHPKRIVSDNGTEFKNKIMDQMTKAIGIDHDFTAAYNPRANGRVERFNQTLVESLRICCHSNPT